MNFDVITIKTLFILRYMILLHCINHQLHCSRFSFLFQIAVLISLSYLQMFTQTKHIGPPKSANQKVQCKHENCLKIVPAHFPSHRVYRLSSQARSRIREGPTSNGLLLFFFASIHQDLYPINTALLGTVCYGAYLFLSNDTFITFQHLFLS